MNYCVLLDTLVPKFLSLIFPEIKLAKIQDIETFSER